MEDIKKGRLEKYLACWLFASDALSHYILHCPLI